MSSTVTVTPTRGVRGIGLFTIIAGVILFVAGAGTWAVVADQLSAEDITVSDDASFFAGRQVNGPLTAYAQAEVIQKHALEIGGGKTYAELPQDDPNRATVQSASFLRASLFTSVVAFGVAALVMGLGIVFFLLGLALRRLAGGPSVAVETPALSSAGDLSGSPRRAPAHAAPATPEPPVVPTPEAPTRRTVMGDPTPGDPPAAGLPHRETVASPGEPPATATPPRVEPTSPGDPAAPSAPPEIPADPGPPPTGPSPTER